MWKIKLQDTEYEYIKGLAERGNGEYALGLLMHRAKWKMTDTDQVVNTKPKRGRKV